MEIKWRSNENRGCIFPACYSKSVSTITWFGRGQRLSGSWKSFRVKHYLRHGRTGGELTGIKAAYVIGFSSVIQLCPILCDPMDCSTPGFPIHHQLSKLAQTHVHGVNDAIQSSHPLLLPSIFPSITQLLMCWLFPTGS